MNSSSEDCWTGQIMETGRKFGRLFELENLHIPMSNLCVVSSPSTLHLWHHRLVHSSLEKLRPLVFKSVLGTSQENGRTERKHRHILDSVCAMLISFSCPERTWGEAVLTVVHVINKLPSSVLVMILQVLSPLNPSSLLLFCLLHLPIIPNRTMILLLLLCLLLSIVLLSKQCRKKSRHLKKHTLESWLILLLITKL
ncbi:uncharacterized protein [Arachis hypogaea]|uniref:uncharacterized protein n=1 Tax=Arachis hypogaea TaxID=3818 RepID=UPI003B2121E1